jgi:hypothetical protein
LTLVKRAAPHEALEAATRLCSSAPKQPQPDSRQFHQVPCASPQNVKVERYQSRPVSHSEGKRHASRTTKPGSDRTGSTTDSHTRSEPGARHQGAAAAGVA